MKEKILGVSDSRPPGRLLTDSEASIILDDFGISDREVEAPYGLAGYYIFYKKGSEFVRCYKGDYIDCLTVSTELQDRLAFLGLAPKIKDETVRNGLYTNVSEYVEPIKLKVNTGKLGEDIAELHNAIENILQEWKFGLSTVQVTSRAMHSMIEKYSISFFDTYSIYDKIILDFYDVFGLIKQSSRVGHGDMHPGNILKNRNKYIFIDFESVFQSKGGSNLDYYNLARFDIDLMGKNDRFKKFSNYLYVKSAIVNHYLEDCGNYVSQHESQKFLQKICRK